MQDSLVCVSRGFKDMFGLRTFEQGKQFSKAAWKGCSSSIFRTGEQTDNMIPVSQMQLWQVDGHVSLCLSSDDRCRLQSHLRTLLSGDFSLFCFQAILWADPAIPGREASLPFFQAMLSVILTDDSGRQFWGCVMQSWPIPDPVFKDMALRALQMTKNAPIISVTVVSAPTGRILTQNPASMAMLGIHGSFNADTGLTSSTGPHGHCGSRPWPSVTLALSVSTSGHVGVAISPIRYAKRMRAHVDGDESYLRLLFDNNEVWQQGKDVFFSIFDYFYHTCQEKLKMAVHHNVIGAVGVHFDRVAITNPTLRSFMNVVEGVEIFHDVQITVTQDLFDGQSVMVIAQVGKKWFDYEDLT